MENGTCLGPEQLRLLYSFTLFRGSASELDLLPAQPPALRPFMAAKAFAAVAAEYPGLLELSQAAGMRDAIQGEIQARRGGEIELPCLREHVGGADADAEERLRAA